MWPEVKLKATVIKNGTEHSGHDANGWTEGYLLCLEGWMDSTMNASQFGHKKK